MDTMAQECVATLEAGVPLLGMCWYPILDRPDWDHLHIWHQSGIWDRVPGDEAAYERVLHEPTGEAFLRAQTVVGGHLLQPARAGSRQRSRKQPPRLASLSPAGKKTSRAKEPLCQPFA